MKAMKLKCSLREALGALNSDKTTFSFGYNMNIDNTNTIK